jgi:hypothetical protein
MIVSHVRSALTAAAALLSIATLAVGALIACGERVEVGLANAPSLERKTEPKSQNDVITTGEEGCRTRDGGPSEIALTAGCQANLPAGVPDGAAPTPAR